MPKSPLVKRTPFYVYNPVVSCSLSAGGHVYISTREVNFIEDEYLKKFFHAALQHHEAQGDWRCLKQEVIPGYLSDWRGFVALFQVMEK